MIEIVEKHLFPLFQYGFVNYALELLVLKTFGEETWEQIKYVTLLPVYHYNFYNSKMFYIFSQIARTFFGIFMNSFWHKPCLFKYDSVKITPLKTWACGLGRVEIKAFTWLHSETGTLIFSTKAMVVTWVISFYIHIMVREIKIYKRMDTKSRLGLQSRSTSTNVRPH